MLRNQCISYLYAIHYARNWSCVKYEKTQITWNGFDVTVHSAKAKAKLTVGKTSARINNLRGNDRAGFLEGNVGAVNIMLGVLFGPSNQWLQAGVINVPNVAASVEEGYSGKRWNLTPWCNLIALHFNAFYFLSFLNLNFKLCNLVL